MKKLIATTVFGLVMFMVTACNQTAEPTNNEKNAGNKQEQELTLQEVFDKTLNASNTLDSFTLNMVMDQDMSISSAPDETVSTSIQADMDIINEPMSLYQDMSIDMNMGDFRQNVAMESYFTEDGFFVYDSTTNQWAKMPEEMFNEVMQLSEEQTDPSVQLNQFKEFVDDFSFQQNSTEYILTLKTSGEKLLDIVKELSGDMLDEELIGEEILNNMNIEQLDYIMHIDKETFLPNKVDMKLTMKMAMEGDEITIQQSTSATYTNINGLEKITVPQEVLDNSVDAQY
ncbi:hypothetical protein OEV98_12020 [Caldibacillus lycopersici]|uniref:Lipoprotein n=1 Tax=Perspicuibacillus lycopersici TaxID=1325689 RepID=A0AAE3LR67_9BACI|nr:DUF6612 family protein [Perspicuibacillus lycopersici]MCU9614289.1 hypothetical protein [Perspicuibacillus lycopersici]